MNNNFKDEKNLYIKQDTAALLPAELAHFHASSNGNN